jgi:hypothetical protein
MGEPNFPKNFSRNFTDGIDPPKHDKMTGGEGGIPDRVSGGPPPWGVYGGELSTFY